MKILIVEDDPFHASFLQDTLAEALPEVTETLHATDGLAGISEARAGRIGAVVMDLQMDKHNGIEAARTIWAERPDTRILFWSNYSDEAYLRGISQIVPEDSAYGYVLKTATRERLELALRAVLIEGQIMVDREIHRFQRRITLPRNALDDSEYAVLLDLALGLQDRCIAERRGMSLRTVQNRLLSLYEKLGVLDDSDGGTSDVPGFNKRVRALHRAITMRILNAELLETSQRDFDRWRARRTVRAMSAPR